MINQRQPVLLPLKQIKVPLEQGWKRKLMEEPGKISSAIHYISPGDNKTFTNKIQIKEYLSTRADMSTLSPDWFVFSPAAILEKELEFESQGGEKKVLNRVPSTELDVMCSRSCPGRGGSRPSLSCSMCLTYYHPKCVHLGEESEDFLCHTCTQTVTLQQKTKRRHLESPAYSSLPDRPVGIIMACLEDTRDIVCAAMVCKQWRRISTTAALWKRAALSGLTLTDNWTLFKEQFSGLARIDTRGMMFSTHINKVWEALAPVLGSVPTLKFITLGTVTSPVVPVLLNSIKGVKHFEAQFIMHDSTRKYNDNRQVSQVELDACFSQPHLRHLILCSPTLLTLSEAVDLTHLRKLQRLQTLSLTGFVPGSLTNAGLGFISHLRNLSALQLGSCSDWEGEQFGLLRNLLNLKHLRLECGPPEPSVGLSSALIKLHQLTQLELILFPLHRTLHDVISQLPKLNLLNLAPIAANNEQLAGMNQIVLTLMKEGNIWCGEWGAVISAHKTCHNNTLIIPIIRSFVADSVLYKAASRRGQGDVLMINVSEAKMLLADSLPEHCVHSVYTLSKTTAHWVKMCH